MKRKYYFFNNVREKKEILENKIYCASNGQIYMQNLSSKYNIKYKEYRNNFGGLRTFYSDINSYMKIGSMILSGNVFPENTPIEDVNLCSVNNHLADSLVLEFNNYLIPKLSCNSLSFNDLLLRVIDNLPLEFKYVSCIAIAKPDFGLNADNLDISNHFLFSGYLIYWLDTYIATDMIYRYLQDMNTRLEYPYAKCLRTSSCKNNVDYTVSLSTHKPNYTIKLAVPEYEQRSLNVIGAENRVVLIEKDQFSLPIVNSIAKNTIYIDDKKNNFHNRVNNILTSNLQDNIPQNKIIDVYDFTILKDKQLYLNRIFLRNCDLFTNSTFMKVHKNAKPFKLKYLRDEGDFSIFSASTSNLGKYYCYRFDPYYLLPIDHGCGFIFEEVDPETYKYHLYYRLINDKKKIPAFLSSISEKSNSFASKCNTELLEKITKKSVFDVLEPVSYVCRTYGGIVLGLQSKKYKRFIVLERIPESKKASVSQWYRQMRRYSAEKINAKIFLRLETIFEPALPSGIDYERSICNLFYPTAYMLLKNKRNDKIPTVKVANLISNKCPNIDTLVHSVCGGYNEAFMFHLWLAKIMQEKKKTKLAWIFQGIQGTGKGLLAELVLSVLFGDYFIKCGVTMFDDRFDAWKDNSLLIFVDEYNRHAHDRKALSKARIKELITEDKVSSRKMFSTSQVVHNYSNYIFATNISDAVEIESSDRRFNVGNWQQIKFEEFYLVKFGKKFFYSVFAKDVVKELEDYARILNKAYYGYILDNALTNEAKHRMADLAETADQTFIRLLTKGDFLGLSVVFEYSDSKNYLPSAQIVFATWIICILDMFKSGKYNKKINTEDKTSQVLVFNLIVFKSEICSLYSAFADSNCKFKKLNNLIKYIFPESKRQTRFFLGTYTRKQGYVVAFHLEMKKLYDLIRDNQAISNRIKELKSSADLLAIEETRIMEDLELKADD